LIYDAANVVYLYQAILIKVNNNIITAYGDFLTIGSYQFHSGFVNIDNFVNHSGEFISLAANQSFLASNSIIITNFVSGGYSDIIVDKEFIIIDNQKHILNKELRYSSEFIYPEISYTTLIIKIQDFIYQYKSDFPPKSLLFLLLPENKQHFTSAFEKAFMQQMEFAFSLFQPQFYQSIKELKSRGSGLTPSGDDFIAGVLFGIDLLEKINNKKYGNIKYKIYEISQTNNLFSSNMLRLAYNSKYFMRIKDFMYAFFYLTLKDVNTAFVNLISIGDTSGADLLTGFFAVILYKPFIFKEIT